MFSLVALAIAAQAAPLPVAAAVAETVTSPAPDAVSVTIYRDPSRSAGGALDIDWLKGFALITERRRIAVPAGASTIRFEGVAGGIVPVSAIVTGLPGGVIEKNRDARLLSPVALIDGSLGRHVTIRRTDPTSGKTSEADAIVRSGSAAGVVLETREGIEVLGCSGLAELPRYDGVPPGLSAQPTLTVETHADRATTVTATLSYLASDFDWEASYVARMDAGGDRLALFSWLTLANGNAEAFPHAELQAVAGTLNRVADAERSVDRSASRLRLRCWPQGRTAGVPAIEAPGADDASPLGEIVVTARRMMAPPPPPPPPPAAPAVPMAQQEGLGDLKLYRLPEPFTIAAHGQKQVALLERGSVPFARIHAFSVDPAAVLPARGAAIRLRMKNLAAAGLGLPLPSGSVVLFAEGAGEPERLVGAGRLRDMAIGEEVELPAGTSSQVRLTIGQGAKERRTARLTNANPRPVTVEVRFETGAAMLRHPSVRLGQKDGMPLWRAVVPAGGEAVLSYRIAPEPAGGAPLRPARRR